MNKSEQLIDCLEGEIAKRDEELAACRVAFENCDLLRARIVELEADSNNYADMLRDSDAELAAIKAQDPVAWIAGSYRDVIEGKTNCTPLGAEVSFVNIGWLGQIALYAAPVSEAKAQGVVMPERQDDQYGDQDAIGWNACIDEVARLNAAPVQRVSVPDGWRELAKRADDFLYSLPETDGVLRLRADLCTMLAAPAAPAADAGIVDMYRHLQKVTPYRFKKIQDASITDGGDVMYFHKDRFDAALLADMAGHCAAKGVV